MNYGQCEHSILQYIQHSLSCPNCKQSDLEQYLKDSDFHASFNEVHP
ncbi:hypothetical protein [Paenibacillus sp. B-A-8]